MARLPALLGGLSVIGFAALAVWLWPRNPDALPRGDTAASNGAKIRVIDDEGHELGMAAPARRIVSLVPAVTELVFAMGAGDRLVGRTRYGTYPPAAGEIPDVGDGVRPSIELVLARNPDLVVLFAGPDNRGVTEALRRAGLPALAIRHNSLDDLERNLSRLGAVTGCVEQARALRQWIAAGLRAVGETTQAHARRSVYYEAWADPPITVGDGSYLDSLISLAGGRNLFGDLAAASPQVSLEAIAVRDPDLILLSTGAGARPSDPASRPGWSAVSAAADGRIRVLDADLLSRLGPRVVAAAASLVSAIHPDLTGRLEAIESTPPLRVCP